MLLRQEGLDDKDLADINAALPDLQALDAALLSLNGRALINSPLSPSVSSKIIAKQRDLKMTDTGTISSY